MEKNTPLINDKKLHIYFADDDPDDIEFFRLAVKEISRQIKITIAKDGYQLLEFLEVVLPDIIFLDMNMPKMNGIECLGEIRAKKKYEKIPVVVYSTTAETDQVDIMYELGANLYIQKPDNFNTIIKTLNHTLSLSMDELLTQPPRERFLIRIHPPGG